MNQRTVFPDAVGVIALRQDNDFRMCFEAGYCFIGQSHKRDKQKLKFRLASPYCI